MRSPHREEQKAVTSIEIILRIALILLLVDPLDDVLMAKLKRCSSASASAPRARRVLRARPLQNFQVPSLRRIRASPLLPRARRVLRARPLQNFQAPSPRRPFTSQFIPRAGRVQTSQELQNFQVLSLRHQSTSLPIPRARRVQTSQILQASRRPASAAPAHAPLPKS